MLVTNRAIDDPRVCVEAEALSRHGHDVTVIGWDRDARKDTMCKRNGIEFLQLKLRSTHGRGITQSLFLAGFWARVCLALRSLRPHVIHCHDLDTLPIGWLCSRLLRARLVFDSHENFPDLMVGHLPSPAVAAMRWLERKLVARCDLVITVGERLAEHFRAMDPPEVVVVGNWKDHEEFQFPSERIQEARRKLGLSDGLIAVCYVANLGRERKLQSLLSAVAADKRFACVIGGDGAQAALARDYALAHSNITYLGRVPHQRVPLITAACDVVYSGYDQTTPHARWGAPNKMYEAIAAGKPLLTNDFGEIGELVRTCGCGVIADVSTPNGLSSALDMLAEPSCVAEMGLRAQSLQGTFSRAAADRRLTDAYGAPGLAKPAATGRTEQRAAHTSRAQADRAVAGRD